MTTAANGKRQLLIRHHNFDALGIFIEHHFGNFGWLQGIYNKCGRVSRPRDNIDLFALQFANNSLHAGAAHTNACANRINRRIIADNRDFRTGAGIAGHRFNFDNTVVNFRHFHGEQSRHELRMGARQENLRAACLAAGIINIGADTIPVFEEFARNGFIAAHNTFATTEIDNDIAIFNTLNRAVNDFTNAALIFIKLAVALSFAHLLYNNLFG